MPEGLTPSQHRRRACLLALAAFVVQAGFAVGFGRYFPELQGKQLSDQGLGIAQNLVAGRGYVEVWFDLEFRAWRPPVFPLLLAANLALFGASMVPIKIMLSLFGAGTVLAVYYLARRLFGDRVALLAGLAAAFNPSAIFSAAWPEPSNLIALLLAAAFVALLRARDGGWRPTVEAGVLIGLLVMTKTFYATFPVIVAVWFLLQPGDRGLKIRKIAIVFGVTAALSLPWVTRNYLLFNQPRLATTDTGLVFWLANSRQWLTSDLQKQQTPPPEYWRDFPTFSRLGEIERDKWFLDDGLKTVRDLPVPYVKRVLTRIWLLWKPFTFITEWRLSAFVKMTAMALTFGPILVFFLASIYLLRQRWRTLFLLYGQIVLLTGSLALVHGVTRYRVPFEPLLIVQAAYAFERLILSRRRGGTGVPSVVGRVAEEPAT